ncbi:uncharacterized protein BJ171DRAFT_427564, partial [Polychytrium aggregatum]|uniref:uncharacterized protein n=1 Tax=Polychytrium aggregatum TaxID=110093 RepID=UPI0022FED463
RPMEVSSKKPVSRARTVVELPKRQIRDPRFESLSGRFNEDLFKRSYGFLSDYRADEMKQLREQIAKTKNIQERERMDRTLQKMISKQKSKERDDDRKKLKSEWKKSELDMVKRGKKPFFLKKADAKKLELVSKFKNMSPKEVDKVLEKRRKRNAAKEHRFMPYERRSA